jgi:transposase
MSKNRRRFSAECKFRVALEAAKGQETLSELASKYGLHPNQIRQWKRQLLDSGAKVFRRNGSKEVQARVQNSPNSMSG